MLNLSPAYCNSISGLIKFCYPVQAKRIRDISASVFVLFNFEILFTKCTSKCSSELKIFVGWIDIYGQVAKLYELFHSVYSA